MLVLYRRIGESIVFGPEEEGDVLPSITVKVLSNDSVNVRLGIEAPRELTILRNEVLERRRRQLKAAKREVATCRT